MSKHLAVPPLALKLGGGEDGNEEGDDDATATHYVAVAADAADDAEAAAAAEGKAAAAPPPPAAPARRQHSSMKRLLLLARPEARLLALGSAALAVAVVSQMTTPYLFGLLLQHVSNGNPQSDLDATALKLLGVFATTAAFTFVRATAFTVAGERVVRRLRVRLFEAILLNEVGFFDGSRTGELANRLSSDTAVVQNAVTVNISMLLRFAAQLLVCLGALLWISWRLTLVMLGVVPLVVVLTARYGRFIKAIGKAYQAALARAGDKACEALANVRTVRSFGMDRVEVRRRDAAPATD